MAKMVETRPVIKREQKISLRQAMMLFLILLFSPIVRFFPSQIAKEAGQAGWLAPFVSFFFLAGIIIIFSKIYKKYPDASLMEVICDVTGKFFGIIILVFYLLWLIILLALYIRYYSIRLTISIDAIKEVRFVIIAMLVLTGIILKNTIETISRMGEIIFYLLVIGFAVLFLSALPIVDINNLIPLSVLDIFPVFKASYMLTGLYAYLVVLLFFSDRINHKETLYKTGIKYSLLLMMLDVLLAIMILGALGHSVVKRAPLPFYLTVKNISLFGAIDRLEAITVTQWILADFILIIVFSYSILCIIKYLFKLSDMKPYVIIFNFFIFLCSMYIATSQFELENFSVQVAIHLNIIFGFALPILIFIIGKIRKKV
jgi:spore germination protein KB